MYNKRQNTTYFDGANNMIRLNIRELRKARKMTIRKLSKVSGVSKSHISNIETNINKSPSVTVICAIAKGLDCLPCELYDYEHKCFYKILEEGLQKKLQGRVDMKKLNDIISQLSQLVNEEDLEKLKKRLEELLIHSS